MAICPIAPGDVERAISRDAEGWERARILSEAGPGHRTEAVICDCGDSNGLAEGLPAIVRDAHELHGLRVHGVQPHHVDRAISADLDGRSLAATCGVVIVGRTERQWLAPRRAAVSRA